MLNDALQAFTYLVATIYQYDRFEDVPDGELTPQPHEELPPQFGVGLPAVNSYVWRKWIAGALPQSVGKHSLFLRLPPEFRFAPNEPVFRRGLVIVTVLVSAYVARMPGTAKHFTLKNASTSEVEKIRIEAAFEFPKGALELEAIESEAELNRYYESLRGRHVLAGTVRVPRVIAGNVFWPPSREALERIQELRRQGEEITFAEVEGRDLSKAWEVFSIRDGLPAKKFSGGLLKQHVRSARESATGALGKIVDKGAKGLRQAGQFAGRVYSPTAGAPAVGEHADDLKASSGRLLKRSLRSARESVTGAVGKVADKGARRLRQAGQLIQKAYSTTAGGAQLVIEYADDFYSRTLGEDERQIIKHCPVVHQVLDLQPSLDADPEVFTSLYNVRVRPVLAAAALGGVGSATLAFDEVLSRVTRRVFDQHRLVGGWAAREIAAYVGGAKADAVNAYMDTVPGASVRGGGWVHRIQHGHDMAAVVEVTREYGTGGAVQALYHVLGRDFFTPAGIPILPAGSDQSYEFLTNLGLGKRAAAALLSVNFVEVLGGVMTALAVIRLWRLARSLHSDLRVRDLVERAAGAAEDSDFITATALLHEALSLRARDGTLALALGTVNLRADNRLNAHFAFRDATAWMAAEEPVLELGGAGISLRGIAAGMALATSDALVRSEQYASHWMDYVRELTRTGVTAFECVAGRLVDRKLIRRIPRTNVFPPRLLSAALNYYLAGRLAGAAMIVPDREIILSRACAKADAALAGLAKRIADSELLNTIALLRRIATVELQPITSVVSAT